jgi:hypothetical protein
MLRFLIGVAFGAAGYWAWQSFGRDLLGMGNDQEATYGGFNSSSSSNGNTSGTTTGSGFGSTYSAPSSVSSDPTTTPSGGSTS